MPTTQHLKPIRSFVKRNGRITKGQQHALATLQNKYVIQYANSAAPIDFTTIFARQAPAVLEIGFGNGQTLLEMAEASPELNFVGIEVHEPGVGQILLGIERNGIQNLKVMQADAVEIISHYIAPNSLARIQIYFPDPWHKKRHHKRRLIQTAFLDLLASRLQANGFLHIATDWLPYAESIQTLLDEHKFFNPLNEAHCLHLSRPSTKFEHRGERLGHPITDFYYVKSN